MTRHAPELVAQSVANAVPVMPARICFDLPESLAHIVYLRKASRCYMECLGLCEDDADDLEILLGELSTNVVRHAKAGSYHVSIEFLTDKYVVHVIDGGVGFSPGAVSTPGTTRPDTLSEVGAERVGGMGLVMIRAIADHIEIHPTDTQGATPGTTVRAEKTIKSRA